MPGSTSRCAIAPLVARARAAGAVAAQYLLLVADDLVELWNRAAVAIMDGHLVDARAGDVALERVIAFDGEVQANGLLARVEITEGLEEALAAWRWFGLEQVAALVERARQVSASTDEAFLDQQEVELDQAYAAVGGESVIEDALARRYAADPEAFSPLI